MTVAHNEDRISDVFSTSAKNAFFEFIWNIVLNFVTT